MIEWYMDKNIGGIYANCLSSEMYELDDAEKILLITEAIKTVNGRIPVVATGNFGENTEEHIEYVKKVGDTGVDTVMLTVPVFCEDDDYVMFFNTRICINFSVFFKYSIRYC